MDSSCSPYDVLVVVPIDVPYDIPIGVSPSGASPMVQPNGGAVHAGCGESQELSTSESKQNRR